MGKPFNIAAERSQKGNRALQTTEWRLMLPKLSPIAAVLIASASFVFFNEINRDMFALRVDGTAIYDKKTGHGNIYSVIEYTIPKALDNIEPTYDQACYSYEPESNV